MKKIVCAFLTVLLLLSGCVHSEPINPCSTDIRLRDVVATGDIFSQAVIFDYEHGIRHCYIGTDKDPWKLQRGVG